MLDGGKLEKGCGTSRGIAVFDWLSNPFNHRAGCPCFRRLPSRARSREFLCFWTGVCIRWTQTDESVSRLPSVTPFPHHVGNHAEPTYCEVCGQSHGVGELNSLEIPSEVELDPADFARYTGSYRSARPGFAMTVTAGDSGLIVQAADNPRVDMVPISRSRFWGPPWLRMPLRFEFGSAGDARRLIVERPWPNEPVVLEKRPSDDSADPVDSE